MRKYNYSRVLLFALLALSFAGGSLILFSTPGGGLGLTPDSVEYYGAAHHVRMGYGWLRYSGTPYTSWPPLYATLLMLVGELGSIVGLAPLESARFFHALVYGLIVLCSGVMFRLYLRSGVLALLATIAVLGSLPLLQASVFVWSEPVFILMSLCLFLGLRRYVRQPSPRLLAALIAITALTCLQRYMGVTLVAAGGLSILLFLRASWLRRLITAALFGVLSFAPLAVWLVYNATTTGEMAGPRPPSEITVLEGASRAADTILRWLFPHPYPSGYFPFGLLAVLIICAGVVLAALRRDDDTHLPAIPAVFTFVYPVLLLTFHSIITLNEIANRDLVPIYPYLIAVLFALLERASRWLASRIGRPRAVYALAAGLVTLWLVAHPLPKALEEVNALRTWCCQLYTWNDLDLVRWLRENDTGGTIYTNSTLPLYTLPMHKARLVGLLGGRQQFTRGAQAGDTVVWFNDSAESLCSPDGKYCHDTDYDLDDIQPRLTLVAELDSGSVWRVRR